MKKFFEYILNVVLYFVVFLVTMFIAKKADFVQGDSVIAWSVGSAIGYAVVRLIPFIVKTVRKNGDEIMENK